ncbi:hypothetical protein HK101_011978 [Irineochytrium annulatum]|nr:hypothetical protein HK101_011978 [Irineochytrium annulatum]
MHRVLRGLANAGRPASPAVRLQRFSTSRSVRAQVEVFIDGRPIKVEQGSAVIQACEQAGVDIPRFCYHERLAIAGNCRMCLVEVEKTPKPVASCAMPVMPGMKIKTNTPMVKKAREGVMEFLLANHPLDCPICDQGGECDLQDQSVRYGSDRSRFSEPAGKRAVEDKDLGPLVKTVMTRCIHCTRCVRFANEVAGAVELGTSGRGNDMQIGTYVEKTMNSEMSGNVIDLCPVGALTSKPYAFSSRPWELKRTESIDVLDAVGSNIRIDSRGLEVMRIVPRLNDDINAEWISDKTRFAYDGLKRQRLTKPLVRGPDGFYPVSWEEALVTIAKNLKGVKGEEMVGVAGALADAESMVALKDFMNHLGSENLRLDGKNLDKLPIEVGDFRSKYVVNSTLNGIEAADAILLVGTNPRHEAPILNTRIRKAYLNSDVEIGVVGPSPNLNYDFTHFGEGIEGLAKLSDTSNAFVKKLTSAKRPLILVGSGVLQRDDAAQVLGSVAGLVQKLKGSAEKGWEIYNLLHRAASWTAALDIGYTSAIKITKPKFLYLLNADEIAPADIPKDAFVVYQGHHGDHGAYFADVVLPGSAYTEKSATYVNTEGRAQVTRAAVAPPSGAREDWKIIRAVAEVSGVMLPYDDVYEIRRRMGDVSPTLVSYDAIETGSFADIAIQELKGKGSASSSSAFDLPIKDFYMTDPISRASSTMAKCSQAYTHGKKLVDFPAKIALNDASPPRIKSSEPVPFHVLLLDDLLDDRVGCTGMSKSSSPNLRFGPKIPCFFVVDVPKYGFLEGENEETLKKNLRMELPFWLVEKLANIVEIEIPKCYRPRVRNDITASAISVNICDLCPYFFRYGAKIVNLVDDPDLAQVLVLAFSYRLSHIATHIYSSTFVAPAREDFLRTMDESEKEMCLAFRHDMTNIATPSGASSTKTSQDSLNADKTWEVTQKRTFTNWVNNHLKSKGHGPTFMMTPETFASDLASGERLIVLLEAISGENASLGKYNKNPRMRIQRVENVNKALDYIKKRGVGLTNIGAEDIVDENVKLHLGLIWSLILRFDISEISEEGLSAKEGLLLWCQRRTTPYAADFHIKDFHTSWTDGLALCGLIHRHRPDLLDYYSLDKSQRRENTKLAMDIAESQLGIPKLMEVEDLVDIIKPDERSVITYISQFYHAFSALEKVGVAGRRIGQFGQILLGSWEMQNDYEKRVAHLLANIQSMLRTWSSTNAENYKEARSQLTDLEKYKITVKREWIVEKRELDSLLSNILTKLKTYHLAAYVPPEGSKPADVAAAWESLVAAEAQRKQDLSSLIRQTRDRMRKEFAAVVNGLNDKLKDISHQLANIDGENELESQVTIVKTLMSSLDSLKPGLTEAESKSNACAEANITDNQYTILTFEDISFDFTLLSQSVTKKIAFLENQIIARSVSNVTAAQLEEWTETFKHFDKDNANCLSEDQFRGALQALGVVTNDADFQRTFKSLATEGLVHFQPFMEHVKQSTEDRTTAADCVAAFQNLSVDKDFITEGDLIRGGVPMAVVSYFKQRMPLSGEGMDYKTFVHKVFE